MNLKEIATALKIAEYPKNLEDVYESISNTISEIPDNKFILEIENKYGALREHLPVVLECWEGLCKDEKLLAWYKTVSEYAKNASFEEAVRIPFPEDTDAVRHMLRLFVVLTLVDKCVERFKAHGFSDEEIKDNLGVIYNSMLKVKSATGNIGLDLRYYDWTLTYIYCRIFNCGSFNFEFIKLNKNVVLLKNKSTSEHVILMTEGEFHKSGQMLGSAGYEDADGSFNADYKETDTAFFGRKAIDGYVSNKVSEFKKTNWECVVKFGDDVISVHIPKGSDLTPSAIYKSYKLGLKTATERFPEHSPKYLYCRSWLIDPRLESFLPENSKILGFGKTFMRFPEKCTGRDGQFFLFDGSPEKDENLPENTSLQRKIKAHYLSGGYTYASSGFTVILDN